MASYIGLCPSAAVLHNTSLVLPGFLVACVLAWPCLVFGLLSQQGFFDSLAENSTEQLVEYWDQAYGPVVFRKLGIFTLI